MQILGKIKDSDQKSCANLEVLLLLNCYASTANLSIGLDYLGILGF